EAAQTFRWLHGPGVSRLPIPSPRPHDGRETGLASRRTDVDPDCVRRLQEGDRDASEIKPCFSSSSPLDVIFLLASVYRQLPLGPFRASYFRAYCGPRGPVHQSWIQPTARPRI